MTICERNTIEEDLLRTRMSAGKLWRLVVEEVVGGLKVRTLHVIHIEGVVEIVAERTISTRSPCGMSIFRGGPTLD